MTISYQEFKERYRIPGTIENRMYSNIIRNIDEFLSEIDVKFFYPKNIYNDGEAEFIVFLDNGYLKVSYVNNEYIFKQYNAKVIMKELRTDRFTNCKHELEITYDKGESLKLNALNDSSADWEEEYCKVIRQIFKSL
jgi:hypothetical protein